MVAELKAVLAVLDHPPVTIDDGQSVVKSHVESYCNAAAFLRDHGQALLDAVADSERYRWLRDNDDPSGEVPYIARQVLNTWGNWVDALDTGPAIDAMIDTARSKTVDGGGA